MVSGGIRPECSLEDCDRPHEAKGYCTLHYDRFRKYGDPKKLITERHGMTNTKVYKTWDSMKERCYGSYRHDFAHYGGRGIDVCARWKNSLLAFYEDMGDPPTPQHTLDRIDSNGNYEPGNCRWATQRVQQNNRSSNRKLTLNGETHNCAEWARKIGINRDTLYKRLVAGWSVEKALTTPHRYKLKDHNGY